MKLILTRHGETEENRKGIVQGHLPGTLSSEGIMQANKLAIRLKKEKIDAIYSSDLKRAADTAKEISRHHPGIKLHMVKALREGSMGSYEGRHKSEVDWKNRPKDVESWQEMTERAKSILDEAYSKYPQGTVVFVAHGGINKALITVIENRPPEDFEKIQALHNTSVCVFEIREDKDHKIHLLNCIDHLK
jgi:broad specificity phosphatase PhoE